MTAWIAKRIARRSYLQGMAIGGVIGLAGCTGSDEETEPREESDTVDQSGDASDVPPTVGYLSTLLTDEPNDIGDFAECIVTIDGMWHGPYSPPDDEEIATNTTEANDNTTESIDYLQANTSQPSDESNNHSTEPNTSTDLDDTIPEAPESGRQYIEFDEPVEADLVLLQDGETELISEDYELSIGTYKFLQLDISEVRGILQENEEVEPTIETPGNAPMQFNTEFEIRPGKRTVFTADVAPVRRGQTDNYLIRPVPRGISVTYEEREEE